jgi:hypothetical protein
MKHTRAGKAVLRNVVWPEFGKSVVLTFGHWRLWSAAARRRFSPWRLVAAIHTWATMTIGLRQVAADQSADR